MIIISFFCFRYDIQNTAKLQLLWLYFSLHIRGKDSLTVHVHLPHQNSCGCILAFLLAVTVSVQLSAQNSYGCILAFPLAVTTTIQLPVHPK